MIHKKRKCKIGKNKEGYILLKDIVPLFDYGDFFIGWKNGYIVKCNNIGVYQQICRIPMSKVNFFLSKIRLCERIFRLFPRIAVELDDQNILISFHGSIYRVNIQTCTITKEHQFIEGMNNPLMLTELTEDIGFKQGFYYGEYTGERRDSQVAIWYRPKTIDSNWECVYKFEKNEIKHIHGIIPDVFRKGVIILTGDEDSESGIWFAQDNFHTVRKIIFGKQNYRACVAFPQKENIVYATDTPLEDNFLYCYCEKDNSIRKLHNLPGTVIYGIGDAEEVYFSTTVEPDSRIKGKKYLFTRQLGLGIKDKYVRCYRMNLVSMQIEEIIRASKDMWPYTLCQFGTIRFANKRKNVQRVLAYMLSVKKYDNSTVIID